MSGTNGRNTLEKESTAFCDFTPQIHHDLRNQGYAWSSFLRSWLLMFGHDEIVCLSGLFNISYLAYVKPQQENFKTVESYRRALARQKKKQRNSTVKNLCIWQFNRSTGKLEKRTVAKAKLPFFWCAISRLREECNFTKRQEKFVLGKLKRKGIIHWKMGGKKRQLRYLSINTIQLDNYLEYVHYLQDNENGSSPGKKYINWEVLEM